MRVVAQSHDGKLRWFDTEQESTDWYGKGTLSIGNGVYAQSVLILFPDGTWVRWWDSNDPKICRSDARILTKSEVLDWFQNECDYIPDDLHSLLELDAISGVANLTETVTVEKNSISLLRAPTTDKQSALLGLELCRRDFVKLQSTGPLGSLGHVLIIWPSDTATFVPQFFHQAHAAWHSENDERFGRSGSRIEPNRACSHWIERDPLNSFREFRVCAELAVQAVVEGGGIGDSILSGPPNASPVERWLFTIHDRFAPDATDPPHYSSLSDYEDLEDYELKRIDAKSKWAGTRVSYFRDVYSASLQLINQLLQEINDKRVAPDKRDVPAWNAELCRLTYRGEEIRSIRRIALNPIKILDAFEEEDWPQRVFSPLSPQASLREAIRTLNDGMKAIEFHGDGGGQGIIWKRRTTQ